MANLQLVKVRTWEGRADDQFIQLTEGMVAAETLEDPVDSSDFEVEEIAPRLVRSECTCSRTRRRPRSSAPS